MSFLPANYEAPKGGSDKYMKFQTGDNRFRVLDSAIVGSELWINHRPVRKRLAEEFSRDEREAADLNKDGKPQLPSHFWAFPVFDYSDNRVKILSITQKTVQKAIQALVQDEDWGDPKEYDLVANQTTEGERVSYTVQPKPHKPLTDDQKTAWEDVKKAGFNMDVYIALGDPFAPKNGSVTIEQID